MPLYIDASCDFRPNVLACCMYLLSARSAGALLLPSSSLGLRCLSLLVASVRLRCRSSLLLRLPLRCCFGLSSAAAFWRRWAALGCGAGSLAFGRFVCFGCSASPLSLRCLPWPLCCSVLFGWAARCLAGSFLAPTRLPSPCGLVFSGACCVCSGWFANYPLLLSRCDLACSLCVGPRAFDTARAGFCWFSHLPCAVIRTSGILLWLLARAPIAVLALVSPFYCRFLVGFLAGERSPLSGSLLFLTARGNQMIYSLLPSLQHAVAL